MSTKQQAAEETWVGMNFANNWEILEKYSCAEYNNIYTKATGDTTKKIKNAHYLVKNNDCGIETYMERTTIGRAINDNRSIMAKCKGCTNGSKLENNTCYYAEQCRIKNLGKIPDRTQKIEVGKTYGNFKVLSIKPSGNYADHQCRADVQCIHCGTIQESRFSSLLDCTLSCDCFRPHSSGETIIKFYLEDHNIPYKAEVSFEDLTSAKGGSLRYDFAVLDKNNQIKTFIEFDGQQHYQEAGAYYNKDGTLQERDKIKNEYAANHNIPLIRIPYTEIMNIYKILDENLVA